MNEPLCRAMIGAGLGEEDVAARLEVDTKTVRRWLEGRVPYRRHRWALAALLQVSDTDLWPQLRGGEGRPGEVLAVYPHRDQVPDVVWLRVLASATREIAILARSGRFLAGVPGALDVVRQRAEAGTRVRICVRDPGAPAAPEPGCVEAEGGAGEPLGLFGSLRASGDVQIRLHRVDHYSGLISSDAQLLALQAAFGIPSGRCPVLHLQQRGDSGMFAVYQDLFERLWSGAEPVRAHTSIAVTAYTPSSAIASRNAASCALSPSK